MEYLDYLLGEFVLKLYAKNEFGNTTNGPPWALILSYEHEIRRAAIRDTEKGIPLFTGLRKALQDPVVKERYVTTPLSLKRSRSSRSPDPNPDKYARIEGGKGKARGKGKDKNRVKGRGKGRGKEQGGIVCKSKTPDGKGICFKYNSVVENCRANKCLWLHVCGVCFKDHPMYNCPEAKGPK